MDISVARFRAQCLELIRQVESGGEVEESWEPAAVECGMVLHIHRRTAHVFSAELSVALEQLQLLEGQDLGLVSREELLSGSIWSTKLGSLRPVADGLQELMQHVINGQG